MVPQLEMQRFNLHQELKIILCLENWEIGNLKVTIDKLIPQPYRLFSNFLMESTLSMLFMSTKMRIERESLLRNTEKRKDYSHQTMKL